MSSALFESATRNKYRFHGKQGQLLTVEDLWDLPLTSVNKSNLDEIGLALDERISSTKKKSLVHDNNVDSGIVKLKEQYEIVVHIIATKQAENAADRQKRENAEKNQKILSIISDKEDEALKALPVEELKKLVS